MEFDWQRATEVVFMAGVTFGVVRSQLKDVRERLKQVEARIDSIFLTLSSKR